MIYFSGGFFDLFFRGILLLGWPCIGSCFSLFLSSVYFLYLLIRLSCYEDGLFVSWTVYITQFIEPGQTISNNQFNVNNLVKLVVLIILRLHFTELVRNSFSEWDFSFRLNHSSGWFVELISTVSLTTSDHNSTKRFLLCHGYWFNNFNDFPVSSFMSYLL